MGGHGSGAWVLSAGALHLREVWGKGRDSGGEGLQPWDTPSPRAQHCYRLGQVPRPPQRRWMRVRRQRQRVWDAAAGGPWPVCSSEAGRASEDIGLDRAPAWQSQLGSYGRGFL